MIDDINSALLSRYNPTDYRYWMLMAMIYENTGGMTLRIPPKSDTASPKILITTEHHSRDNWIGNKLQQTIERYQ